MLNEALMNKSLFHLLIKNEKLLSKICDKAFTKDAQYFCSDFLKILIKINENILRDIPYSCTKKSSPNDNDMFGCLNMGGSNEPDNKANESNNFEINEFLYIFKILKNGVTNVIQILKESAPEPTYVSTFNKSCLMLGVKRLLVVEYFRSILDLVINAYSLQVENSLLDQIIEEIIENKFFSILLVVLLIRLFIWSLNGITLSKKFLKI